MTRYHSKADISTTVFRAIKRLILSGGLEAVTMRNIAHEAETSTGALRNRWADKSILVREACRAIQDDLGRAALRRMSIAAGRDGATERGAVGEALDYLAATLPYDDVTIDDMAVWWAFRGRARCTDDPTRRLVEESDASWLDVCRKALRHVGVEERLVEGEALRLHLLMDGMRHRFCDRHRFTVADAYAVLSGHLAGLVPHLPPEVNDH